jgi:hypothetical protein
MIEEELRRMFRDRAARVAMQRELPAGVVRRARRKLLRIGGASALAIVVLASASALTVRGVDRRPSPRPEQPGAEMSVRLVADVSADPHRHDEGTADDAAEATALRRFAECMRGQGFDVPDPVLGDEGWTIPVTLSSMPEDTPAWREAALVVCRPRKVDLSGDLVIGTEMVTEAELATFTGCVRGEGFDLPDPSRSGDEYVFDLRGVGFDPNTDAFQRATLVTCAPNVGGGIP